MAPRSGKLCARDIARVASWTWLLVCTLETALCFAPPEGLMLQPDPSVRARFEALSFELLAWGVAIGSITMLAIAARAMLSRWPSARQRRIASADAGTRRWASRALRGLRGVAGTGLCFVVLSAWGTLHQTGAFPGAEGVRFWTRSSIQLAQHVAQQSPILFVGVPLASVALGLALSEGLGWALDHAGPRARRGSVWLTAGLAGATLVGTLTGSVWTRTSDAPRVLARTGLRTTEGEAFITARDERAGPLAHALAEWRRDETSPLSSYPPHPDLEIERRKILSMGAYRAQAERRGFRRHNVIVLLVESLRHDQLRLLGSHRDVMPHLDRLAARARVFSDAYTQASHSDLADPCPLASQYPIRGLFGSRTYVESPPYPRVLVYDVLGALGWRTALISSQNETWGDMLTYLDTGHLDRIIHSETFEGPTYVPRDDSTFTEFLKGTRRAGKIDDRFTVSEAIRWIDTGGSAPFFIYMNLQNSHVPYEIPADYPLRFSSRHAEAPGTFSHLDASDVPMMKNRYQDALGYVDRELGRLLEHLRQRRLLDDTIFVVTGDTGQAFMEHGFFTHARDLFDEVMRVPIVVWAPGLAPGVDGRLAQHVDVAPTVLDLLGLPPHPAFQGRSLVAPEPPSRSAYLVVRTNMAHQYGVVHDGMKLVLDQRAQRPLLYDLRADPGEHHELHRQRPRLTRDLGSRVATWLRAHLDYYADAHRMATEYPPVVHERGRSHPPP